MLRGEVKGTSGQPRHCLGVLDALLARADIGVTAVDDQGLTDATTYPLPGRKDGRSLDPIPGKEAGHLRRHLGINKGQILGPRCSLYPTGDTRCLKTLWSQFATSHSTFCISARCHRSRGHCDRLSYHRDVRSWGPAALPRAALPSLEGMLSVKAQGVQSELRAHL